MKFNLRVRKLFPLVLLLLLNNYACQNKMELYYQEPDWLKGSIYEVLQERGDYSIFLKGIELAGFKSIVNGKSILTVMAPTDSAFNAYLEEHYGGKSIEELPRAELKKLIGFHILYYAFDKEKLINFRPGEGDGATKEEKLKNAGLYYKHRTKSQDGLSLEIDTAGAEVSVYHMERFLPVFSYRMFQTKQIDARYNYEYFFPTTAWIDDAGFNVSNAAVTEYSVLADNGYVYLVDRVLKPLETIYAELASNEDYSDFLELYDKYEYYQLDENLTLEYGDGTDLYQHYHSSPLPNIACEWPVTDYKKVTDLAFVSYSVFAPSNEAFRGFFREYWEVGGYDSLSEVSKQSIEYLLYNSVYSSSMVFPEEITKGLIENSYGTVIKFDVDRIPQANRKICVNGSFYGCSELTPPAMFGSVTGPAFQYKKYSYFLKMLNTADLILTLCSDATSYFMLYPSNELMNQDGITQVEEVLYRGSNKLSNSSQQNYVYAHVLSQDAITGSYRDLLTDAGTGNHVFRTLSPGMYLYWYMKDGKITNSVKFTELLYNPALTEDQLFCSLQELSFRDGWTNGKCYAYQNDVPYLFEGSMENAIYSKFVPMMIGNRNNSATIYHGFVQLLELSGLLDFDSQSVLPVVESCLMFVPSTAAVKQAVQEGRLPGIVSGSATVDDAGYFGKCTVTNADSLQYYLLKYFIPMSTAVISNYPYVGWEENTAEGLPTLQSYDEPVEGGKVVTITTKIDVSDAGGKLSLQELDNDGNPVGGRVDVVEDYHYFPFIFDDACVHFIKEVL
jgi:uncharacterized surface protein with fasciclin (FAS1) repeats